MDSQIYMSGNEKKPQTTFSMAGGWFSPQIDIKRNPSMHNWGSAEAQNQKQQAMKSAYLPRRQNNFNSIIQGKIEAYKEKL